MINTNDATFKDAPKVFNVVCMKFFVILILFGFAEVLIVIGFIIQVSNKF